MNAPTLLVGLGGTGSDIVQKVYHRATPAQRKNIAFVIIDTDVNELRVIEERTPQIRTIQTSARLTVGEYLECDHYSRDNWFPVNRILNGKALTEGAGQVRSVSRLALNTSIQQGKMAPLNEAIEQLYKLKGQKTVQAPRVILAGSLCGGTGSGLILPVAMYIRNFMSTKLQQGSAIIRGFFLLPEVFNGVIKSQSERNNLRSNAYAAVREIDAFMMKDDGSLPSQYDLHFYAPRAGSNLQEEYTGRPMDFCFLFDAQNLKVMKLNSFAEYKDHAANCIYGMAIAPTSKRSNSSEDNVIREIVFAGGRNRFAGAGSSMLIYPTDDIKQYLALTWTKASISDEWLEVDRQFADKLKTNQKMRKQGYQVAELDRGDDYIDTIKQGYTQRKPFASAIRNLCFEFDAKGFVEKGINWTQYADALDSYIETEIENQKADLQELLDDIKLKAAGGAEKTAKEDTFTEWYQQLLGYKNATIKCTGALARNISYSLFKEAKDMTKSTDKFRLEYWLHHNQNIDEFIHPNAVRFFLYNALNELKAREAEKRDKVREIEEYWERFEKKTFDLADTQDHVETESEYYEATHLNDEKFKRFLHRSVIAETQANLVTSFNGLFGKTNDYWDAYVSSEIYRSAIGYIKNLCNAFHGFYDALDRSITKIDKEIQQLEKKYVVKPGEALRYVCADQKCLRGLASDVVNLGSSLDIPSELTCKIFNKIKAYALAEKKPESEEYFNNMFKDTVVKYLEEEIMNNYGSVVDMDIISALEKEAHYENPDKVYELEDQRLYAKHVIESTQLLANPFIESPIGKEPRIIPACAYSSDLTDPEKADFPGRKEFVAQTLKDGGGVDVDAEEGSITKNMILFYQAVYDIRANELSKFAPPKKADTFERQGGEYYKAYYELIEQIHPKTDKSKAITPHIDRWWHVISKLPDLDEKSQEMQEKRINSAFFWGMLGNFIQLRKEDKYTKLYYADEVTLSELKDLYEDEHLVVSNGTPCDHLYEVLDAFTIFPQLVSLVLDKVNGRINGELYRKVSLEKSLLYDYLRNFRIQEYDLVNSTGESCVRSVFELPILMKLSVPAEDYHEASVIRLMIAILDELKSYIGRFCNKKEVGDIYGKLLREQFELFINNIKMDEERLDDIYNDSLFNHICKTLAKEFEELNMRDDAFYVQDTLRKLNK